MSLQALQPDCWVLQLLLQLVLHGILLVVLDAPAGSQQRHWRQMVSFELASLLLKTLAVVAETDISSKPLNAMWHLTQAR